MAQTGFTPIQLYSTSTAAAAPIAGNLTNSTLGSELAINITDGKLFYKDNANAVQVIGWKTVPTTAGGTGLTTYTAGDLSYYASGTTFTKLAIGTVGQILTSTGSAPQWSTLSGVAVTTFSAGTTGFTPNSATSGAVTLAGTLATTNGGTGLTSFTANGILYASSTSALATGSNLTFDGSTFTSNVPLVISANSASDALRITQIGAGNALVVEDSATPDATPVVISAEGSLTIGNINRLAFRSSFPGNLTLMGTTYSPGALFNIARFNNGTGGAGIEFNHSRSGTIGTNTVLQSGDSFGNILFNGADGTGYISGASISADVDGTPGTNDMPGRLVFSTTADGASSPTERMRITSAGNINVATGNLVISTSGKGIDFSATAGTGTSELFADYEEGTWTPVDTSGAGLTLTNEATATYTKVGRQVTASFWVKYPVTVDVSGAAIGGLPFTAAGGVSGSVVINQTEYATPITGQVSQGGTQTVFFTFGNTGITNANFSNLRVRATAVYFV